MGRRMQAVGGRKPIKKCKATDRMQREWRTKRKAVTVISAGEHEIDWVGGMKIRVQRAWQCPVCTCSWFDTGPECPKCGTLTGAPEPLPKNARVRVEPDKF